MYVKKNSNEISVLFCPLNWGLGHATRIVPIIRSHIQQGDKVFIAASGNALAFLQSEFPDIDFIKFKGLNVRYFRPPFLFVGLLLQTPLFALSIVYEYFKLKKILKKQKINLVISDNRYGVRTKKVKSVLITHQLYIQLPKSIKIISPALHLLTKYLISKFYECRVPDYEDIHKSLSGELSHSKTVPDNVKYIGPLSRFSGIMPEPISYEYNTVIIISGPEPEKTQFMNRMIKEYENKTFNTLIVAGNTNLNIEEYSIGAVKVLPHLKTEKLMYALLNCNTVIARCGYSTIMDMHILGIKTIKWFPVKGQTEQEYLYKWLSK